MKLLNSVKTADSVTVILKDGAKTMNRTVRGSDDRYTLILKYIKDKKPQEIWSLLDTGAAVETLSKGGIKVDKVSKKLTIDLDEMPEALAARIKSTVAAGIDPTPFIEFWKRLKKNPSENSRQQFYLFVENCYMNITSDGHVILYKGLNSEYRSQHCSKHTCRDGTVIDLLHKVGEYLEIPREDATDNKHVDCASGLHCAPWKYVRQYYNHNVVELLVDPADIVSVPVSDGGHKLRACRYKVIQKCGADFVAKEEILASSAKKKVNRVVKIHATALELTKGRIILLPDMLAAIGANATNRITVIKRTQVRRIRHEQRPRQARRP